MAGARTAHGRAHLSAIAQRSDINGCYSQIAIAMVIVSLMGPNDLNSMRHACIGSTQIITGTGPACMHGCPAHAVHPQKHTRSNMQESLLPARAPPARVHAVPAAMDARPPTSPPIQHHPTTWVPGCCHCPLAAAGRNICPHPQHVHRLPRQPTAAAHTPSQHRHIGTISASHRHC